jgi:hypothetical protein
MNHEWYEEHEVVQCAITDLAVTFRVNPIAAIVFDDPWFFFVFLRVFVSFVVNGFFYNDGRTRISSR